MKMTLLLIVCAACTADPVKPAAYSAGLEECNRTSKSCAESIACENKLRAAQTPPRPLRDVDAGCN
jgi:hypothetical protein